jgi:hypothetical protein
MDGGFFGHISATSEHFHLRLDMGQILRPGRTFLACLWNQRVLIYHQYGVKIENHNFQLGPQSFGTEGFVSVQHLLGGWALVQTH